MARTSSRSENEVPVQEKVENPVTDVPVDKVPENETPAKEEPVPDETEKKPIEAIIARSVIALLYAVEQLNRARNPEITGALAERRGELESAVAALEEE